MGFHRVLVNLINTNFGAPHWTHNPVSYEHQFGENESNCKKVSFSPEKQHKLSAQKQGAGYTTSTEISLIGSNIFIRFRTPNFAVSHWPRTSAVIGSSLEQVPPNLPHRKDHGSA